VGGGRGVERAAAGCAGSVRRPQHRRQGVAEPRHAAQHGRGLQEAGHDRQDRQRDQRGVLARGRRAARGDLRRAVRDGPVAIDGGAPVTSTGSWRAAGRRPGAARSTSAAAPGSTRWSWRGGGSGRPAWTAPQGNREVGIHENRAKRGGCGGARAGRDLDPHRAARVPVVAHLVRILRRRRTVRSRDWRMATLKNSGGWRTGGGAPDAL
jgi:hypothetical protein